MICGDSAKYHLWGALNLFANIHTGIVEASTVDLAKETNIDKTKVHRLLQIFLREGLITIEKSFNQHEKSKISVCNYIKNKSEIAHEIANEIAKTKINETANSCVNDENHNHKQAIQKKDEIANLVATEMQYEMAHETANGCSLLPKKEGKKEGKKNRNSSLRSELLVSGGARSRSPTAPQSDIPVVLTDPAIVPAPIPAKERIKKAPKAKPDGSLVWDSYCGAYATKYGHAPARNAKQNALCSQLVTRLGVECAVLAARFYVFHGDFFYTKRCHPLDLLVKDAEKVDIERRKGQIMTTETAQQSEVRAFNQQVLRNFMKREDEREAKNGKA
jgi:DNA-binding MarR family transcriptional regulator